MRKSTGWWFDGGENGKIHGKGMNAARQSREHFRLWGRPHGAWIP